MMLNISEPIPGADAVGFVQGVMIEKSKVKCDLAIIDANPGGKTADIKPGPAKNKAAVIKLPAEMGVER